MTLAMVNHIFLFILDKGQILFTFERPSRFDSFFFWISRARGAIAHASLKWMLVSSKTAPIEYSREKSFQSNPYKKKSSVYYQIFCISLIFWHILIIIKPNFNLCVKIWNENWNVLIFVFVFFSRDFSTFEVWLVFQWWRLT